MTEPIFTVYTNQIVINLEFPSDKPCANDWIGSVICQKYLIGHFAYRLLVNPVHRNKGYGTTLMNKVYEICNTPIYLEPESYIDSPLTTEDLVRWYHKLGYMKYSDDVMIKW